MSKQESDTTTIDWTPTTVLRLDPLRQLTQLWVRVRTVQITPKNDLEYIRLEEVIDTQWRRVS